MAAFAILLSARATFSALKAGTVALIQGFSVQEHPPGGEHPVALTVIKHRVHWVCAYTLLRPTKGQKCLTANRDFNTFLLDLSFKKTEKQPKKKTNHKTKHHQQTQALICHFVSEVGRRSLFTFLVCSTIQEENIDLHRAVLFPGFTQTWPRPQHWSKLRRAALLPSHVWNISTTLLNWTPTHLAPSMKLQIGDLKLLVRS